MTANLIDGVGVVRGLVVPVPFDAGEAEGDSTRVAGAPLHAVKGDLVDDLRLQEPTSTALAVA